MITEGEIAQDADLRMDKSLAVFKHGLTKVRTGRAQPSLLEHITVSYYGSEVPLNQAANITVQDAHTLSITAWDKKIIFDIEKVILSSGLGLNPVIAGEVIRVPLPALTEDRRKELTKIVRSEGEKTKVAVRNIRRDAVHSLKNLVKDKEITENDERREEKKIQKLTDKHVETIDKILVEKERELMEV